MGERRVQYAVVEAADADIGPAAPGFRATWQSKDELKEQLLNRKNVPHEADLYFWDGELWLEWDDEAELPGVEVDPLRVKVVHASTGSGTALPADIFESLRRFLLDHEAKARTLSISAVKSEHWKKIQSTAKLILRPYPGDVTPTTPRTVDRFSWEDALERAQAFRYIAFLKASLGLSEARQQSGSRLVVVDAANNFPKCLETRGQEDRLFYNFRGTTDVLISITMAVKGALPESASIGAMELKKDGKVTGQSIAQACVTLIILNIKSSWLQPWVLLTDLRDQYLFYWLDGSVLYFYSPPESAAAWGILDDLLKHDRNVTFQEPPADIVSRLAILQRQPMPEAILGHGSTSDVANLEDVMDVTELEAATVQRVLQQLSFQPVLGPMIPTKAIPFGMYS